MSNKINRFVKQAEKTYQLFKIPKEILTNLAVTKIIIIINLEIVI
jgi:hypothetical protein